MKQEKICLYVALRKVTMNRRKCCTRYALACKRLREKRLVECRSYAVRSENVALASHALHLHTVVCASGKSGIL